LPFETRAGLDGFEKAAPSSSELKNWAQGRTLIMSGTIRPSMQNLIIHLKTHFIICINLCRTHQPQLSVYFVGGRLRARRPKGKKTKWNPSFTGVAAFKTS